MGHVWFIREEDWSERRKVRKGSHAYRFEVVTCIMCRNQEKAEPMLQKLGSWVLQVYLSMILLGMIVFIVVWMLNGIGARH